VRESSEPNWFAEAEARAAGLAWPYYELCLTNVLERKREGVYRDGAHPVLSWQIIDRGDRRVMQSFAVGLGNDTRRIADAIRQDLETLRREDFEQEWGIDRRVDFYSREATAPRAHDAHWKHVVSMIGAALVFLVVLGVLASVLR
jgi:hypothetical protein